MKKLALYMVTKWAPVTLARSYDVGGVRTGERPVNVDYVADEATGICDVVVSYQTLNSDFKVRQYESRGDERRKQFARPANA